MTVSIRRLTAGDVRALRAMNALFADAFEDPQAYLSAPPDDAYLTARLAKPHVIALAAFDGETLIGGVAGYVLEKFEQARSELYIYDLAVALSHLRRGVATALIEALKPVAREAGAAVIFVQADYEDPPAIALYEMLGVRQAVLHFDIEVDGARR